MALIACGINYKTADLKLRERLAITPEKLSPTLNHLIQHKEIKEAAILSTCNRTEIYCAANKNIILLDWLSQYHQISANELQPHYYQYHDHAVFKHALRVASGLDSMILGEPEIFGQMKNAVASAEQVGTVGKRLKQLFSAVFSASKTVRTQTAIGVSPLTISTITTTIAKRIFADLAKCKVLCIGAGDTINMVAQHLVKQDVTQLVIANRTKSRAQQLANKFNATAISLNDLSDNLSQADIIIAATLSELPILGKGVIESALKKRKHKPILIIDLAVPRNIEAQIAQLNDVYLYTLDDFQRFILENKDKRELAAQQAENIIDLQTTYFMKSQKLRLAAATIRSYREKMQNLRDQELKKAMQRVSNGENPQQILHQFSESLLNKLLHQPTMQLRRAALEDQTELFSLAREMFDVD